MAQGEDAERPKQYQKLRHGLYEQLKGGLCLELDGELRDELKRGRHAGVCRVSHEIVEWPSRTQSQIYLASVSNSDDQQHFCEEDINVTSKYSRLSAKGMMESSIWPKEKAIFTKAVPKAKNQGMVASQSKRRMTAVITCASAIAYVDRITYTDAGKSEAILIKL